MDPNANIEEQLRLVDRLLFATENDRTISEQDVHRLAELVIALDEWLVKGGFAPKRWAKSVEEHGA